MPVIEPAPFQLSGDFPETFSLQLMSDLHIGSSMVDYSLIEWELEQARLHNRRILLGGDVFDCIFPSDRTRFQPSALHPRLRGREDIQDEELRMGEELLSPYADLIDFVGTGNHEAEALHRHHTDMTGGLVRCLNKQRSFDATGEIAQAGWSAFVHYRLSNFRGRNRAPSFTIWYHHGLSASGYTHRVLRTLQERSSSFQADCYWSGHAHVRGTMAESRVHSGPSGVQSRPVRYILTGAYYRAYEHQSQDSMVEHGRKSNYIVERGYAPASLGGAVINLTWDHVSPYPTRIEVIQ